MTLYEYSVIFNPIKNWLVAKSYFVDNQVKEGTPFYKCKLAHTSAAGNKPPNGTFWDVVVPVSPNQVITEAVETVKITESGSGEIRSLALRFDAEDGAFITNTNGGETPILDEFDKIEVNSTDFLGRPFTAIYEVDILYPTEDGKQGRVLPVDLLAPEQHLMKTMFAKQFFFKSGGVVAEGVITLYNTNKGSLQPRVINHTAKFPTGFNNLDRFTANDYLFNLSQKTHYNGLVYVLDRTGSSVAAGGAGDFFEATFETDDTNQDQIKFKGFSSGNPPDQSVIPNIRSTTSVNPAEEEGGIHSTAGTLVATWGSDGVGYLPKQNSDYIGALESWPLFPVHISGETYPSGAIILVPGTTDDQGDNFHYKANKLTTNSPPTPPTTSNTDWDQYKFVAYLTNEVQTAAQYSFWTNAKQNAWRSNGANTPGALQEDPPTFKSLSPINAGSMALFDSNQNVQDIKFKRTSCDIRAVTFASIPSQFKRNGKVYRGFRVLVDTALGTPDSTFAPFTGQITMWDGEDWILFRLGKTNVNGSMVGEDHTAKVYQFEDSTLTYPDWTFIFPRYIVGNNVSNISKKWRCIRDNTPFIDAGTEPGVGANEALFWTEISASGYVDISGDIKQGNECYHPVYNITHSQGSNDKSDGAGSNVGKFSAIIHEFRYENNDILDAVRDEPQYYRIYAGANLRFPFPFNSFNNNSIGSIYGDNDSLEPATLESFNMNLTPSGLTGFNNVEAENLGPLDSLVFHGLFEWRFKKDGTGSLVRKGNFACRCGMEDIDGAVVIQDFVIPINGLWERNISLPLGEFKAYEARTPFSFGDASQNIFLQELEVLEKFRWRNIKKISIHWLGPYDDEGRFVPFNQTGDIFPDIIDFLTNEAAGGFNIKFGMDFVGFSKPLLSVSPPVISGRAITPNFFEEPLITNKIQNDQANLAKLEIMKFRIKTFETTTELRFDIPYGYSYFLENPFLVSNADRTLADLPAWVTSTEYFAEDSDVSQGSTGYRCILDHTSATINKPGTGATWETFWVVLTTPVPNTIKLVNKQGIHTFDKLPSGSVGGALSTFIGTKRFE